MTRETLASGVHGEGSMDGSGPLSGRRAASSGRSTAVIGGVWSSSGGPCPAAPGGVSEQHITRKAVIHPRGGGPIRGHAVTFLRQSIGAVPALLGVRPSPQGGQHASDHAHQRQRDRQARCRRDAEPLPHPDRVRRQGQPGQPPGGHRARRHLRHWRRHRPRHRTARRRPTHPSNCRLHLELPALAGPRRHRSRARRDTSPRA